VVRPAVLEPMFKSRRRDHWLKGLAKTDILCYPINSFAKVVEDLAQAAALSPSGTVGNLIAIETGARYHATSRAPQG